MTMARLTLRLPETLHRELAHRAEREGVSMNQYLVFLLSRASAVADVHEQRVRFEAMTNHVSDEEAEAALGALLAERA